MPPSGRTKRGEVWWACLEERQPVVRLSGSDGAERRAMRIVPPATVNEKRGFVVLSSEEACDIRDWGRMVAAAGSAVRGVGIEVRIVLPRSSQRHGRAGRSSS